MDAANPIFSSLRFDVVLCRHVLWALPQPATVLQRWSNLLLPGGRLLLIEGYGATGGLHVEEAVAALPPSFANVTVDDLSNEPQLWGGSVTDERYAVIADRQ
jgi:SAM-dependent methyltransferase